MVDRAYEAVNDPSDVRRDGDGVWHIKPGAMVRVRMTMVADTNHTNMALVDARPGRARTTQSGARRVAAAADRASHG